MGSFTPVFVSHHQFQVHASGESDDDLGLYLVGDDLAQVTGRGKLTVMTGPHSGEVGVRLAVHSSAPRYDVDGWDAAAEATLWCPHGRIAVCGLMGDCPEPLRDLGTGRAGLLRVRVHARHRRPDGHPPEPGKPEHYLLDVWPVDVDTGHQTLRSDDLEAPAWAPDRAHAAGWAMLRLLDLANPDPREVNLRRAAALAGIGADVADPPVDRVTVRRRRTMPIAHALATLRRPGDHLGATTVGEDLVLPAGEVEIRWRPRATPDRFIARWSWNARRGSSTAVPDTAGSTVELSVDSRAGDGTADLVVVHHGVPGSAAVLLGLVWDHLLERAAAVAAGGEPAPLPWAPMFDVRAAKAAARAAADRRSRDTFEARRWGGVPPTDRLRALPANALSLALLDRDLLDALADAPPRVQRAVAVWAARQACSIAGLATIDWIADALAALDRGDPLPPPFRDDQQPWEWLSADERVPLTTVTIATGTANCSQQHIALPAIRAAAYDDPLAAAVDTVYFAALAYGEDHRSLLAAATGALTRVDPDT